LRYRKTWGIAIGRLGELVSEDLGSLDPGLSEDLGSWYRKTWGVLSEDLGRFGEQLASCTAKSRGRGVSLLLINNMS
jgi:hypothetical protein